MILKGEDTILGPDIDEQLEALPLLQVGFALPVLAE